MERHPIHQRVAGSIPHQGTHLGISGQGMYGRQPMYVLLSHINVCPSLFLSLFPPSLLLSKINKMYAQVKIKNVFNFWLWEISNTHKRQCELGPPRAHLPGSTAERLLLLFRIFALLFPFSGKHFKADPRHHIIALVITSDCAFRGQGLSET